MNYAFYVGGAADHLSIEATGAAVVPVGLGQRERLLDLFPVLRPNAMFSITSYAHYLAEVARRRGLDPAQLGLRTIVGRGEPAAMALSPGRLLGVDAPVPQQQLRDAVAAAHQLAPHLLAGAGEVAGGLERGWWDGDRRQRPGHQQPDEQLGILAIGLDTLAGGARRLRGATTSTRIAADCAAR